MLATVGLVSSCGRPASPSTSSPASASPTDVFEQQRTDGVNSLLDKLDKALLRGRPADLDALLDRSASKTFRQQLHVAQDNLSSAGAAPSPAPRAGDPAPVRYRIYQHFIGSADAEELVPDAVANRLAAEGSSDNWVSPVRLRFALGGTGAPGLDEPEIEIDTPLVVARYDDEWKLVGDLALLGRPATGAGLWSFPGARAQTAQTAGGQSVVASYPQSRDLAARIAALLPDSVRAVSAFWGANWPQRALVVTAGTDQQFAALATSPDSDTADAAAATVYTALDVPNHTVTGQRIVFTPAARQLPPAMLAVVLRHELSHVAVRLATGVDTPLWLAEGLAEYVGRKGSYTRFDDVAPDLAAATRTGTPPSWPTDEDFTVDSQRAALAYQSAWSIAAFVAQSRSEDALRKMYLGVAGAADPEAAKIALASAVGVPQGELERQWRAWVRKQSGG